ncbi:uncharacterized protein At4g06744-like [Miscanthus floridulus]|uniref:uncharacterized protein At4g06744-like n=1 Tax=Miscanthus floridulus TaxID=154761 RepID=UPI00345A48A1
MANHPKCHSTQNILILLSYTAAIVAVSTLSLPLLASSQSLDFARICVGPKNILELCVGAEPKRGNSVSLVATVGATNARALIHNSEDISGPLPQDFGFSNLSYLGLANNNLSGPIPASVGHLHGSLLEIVLLNNQLSGCLPHELGMLNKAAVIDAEALCKLAGPAGRLGNLTLRGNYFTSVGPACSALIKGGLLDVKNNCIPGFANQKRPAECLAFQSQPKTCPEAFTQVSCPAAATTNAAASGESKARDYYSYLTYASLRE